MQSPDSLDSIGWDPSYQIATVAMLAFLSSLYLSAGNLLLALLGTILVFLPLPLILVRFPYLQRRLLFHSWYYRPEKPLDQPELYGLNTARNRRIGALGCWYLPATRPTAPVVVYCHGSSGSRANEYRVDLVRFLGEQLGCTVYSFDYRGYADSPGCTSEHNSVQDAREVVALARTEHPASRVLLYGHSMGTGVACQAAYQESNEGRPVGGLILEAPFLSIPDTILKSPAARILNSLYGGFIWQFSDLFMSRNVIGHLDNVLILFAENDEVIPVEHATTLHELCPSSSILVTKDGRHNFLIHQEEVKIAIKLHLEKLERTE